MLFESGSFIDFSELHKEQDQQEDNERRKIQGGNVEDNTLTVLFAFFLTTFWTEKRRC
jgi:hypothetical protein